ncbi:MAG: hypothetical protein HC913_08100 [Microscillaceae bacterium]|nr:hypothetical protein [Microscillaceae bacterium]
MRLAYIFLPLPGQSQKRNRAKKDSILVHSEAIVLKPMNQLNTSAREVNLCITPDGQCLLFMSGRGQMPWSNNRYTIHNGKEEADGDIWFTFKDEKGAWKKPEVAHSISTSNGEDEPNISPDMLYLYFQSWRDNWETSGGPYYRLPLLQEGKDLQIEGLGGGLTTFFQTIAASGTGLATDGATLSPDGNTFIFAFGQNYSGQMDLYLARRQEATGIWEEPKKMALSTPQDERNPFLAGDGKTLYFVSDGYTSRGGLDIFMTTLQPDGTTGQVFNIGAPFNSHQHEEGFVIPRHGKEAFLVREGDIYHVELTKKAAALKPAP